MATEPPDADAMAPAEAMRAAIQVAPGKMRVEKFPIPVLGDDEVLVKVERAAICGSDLHSIFDGLGYLNAEEPLPGRPGHEAVGRVARSNSNSFAPGDRVLVLGFGSYAEYLATPATQCVAVPETVDAERLVLAQQLGVVLYGMKRFWPSERPGGVAAIVGAGPVGYLFASRVRTAGFATVIVSDTNAERLNAVLQSGGADRVVLVGRDSLSDVVAELSDGRGADLVIEAAGSDAARHEAIECVATDGRVGLFGYPETTGSARFPYADVFWKAPVSIEVVSRTQAEPGLVSFRDAVRLVADDAVELSPLMGCTFELAEINAALAQAREQRSLKVQVRCG